MCGFISNIILFRFYFYFFFRLLPKDDLYSSWLRLWNNLSTAPHLVNQCPPWEADGCSSTQEVIQNYPKVRGHHLILSWPFWIQSHSQFIHPFPSTKVCLLSDFLYRNLPFSPVPWTLDPSPISYAFVWQISYEECLVNATKQEARLYLIVSVPLSLTSFYDHTFSLGSCF